MKPDYARLLRQYLDEGRTFDESLQLLRDQGASEDGSAAAVSEVTGASLQDAWWRVCRSPVWPELDAMIERMAQKILGEFNGGNE